MRTVAVASRPKESEERCQQTHVEPMIFPLLLSFLSQQEGSVEARGQVARVSQRGASALEQVLGSLSLRMPCSSIDLSHRMIYNAFASSTGHHAGCCFFKERQRERKEAWPRRRVGRTASGARSDMEEGRRARKKRDIVDIPEAPSCVAVVNGV